jgi:hypothetical protein
MSIRQFAGKYFFTVGVAALGLLFLSLALAGASNSWRALDGWGAFLTVLLLAALLMVGCWRLLKYEQPPAWLGALLIGALVLRLAAGAFWLTTIPRWGHGTSTEKAGYVMADAASRDQAAWKLARSDRPLWMAFTANRKVDQYGGLLFSSALIYRYLGGKTHYPLMMVVPCAALSALGVLFTWAFARRAWKDRKIAALSAWILALYPEAVLLGSSQMREAITITLAIAAFYGFLRYQQEHSLKSLGWVITPVALCLPFSPLIAALVLGMLALSAAGTFFSRSRQAWNRRGFWIILGVIVLVVLAGLYLALSQFTPEGMNNPLEMLSWWLKKSANLQAYLSKNASGWMQKIFRNSPTWLHLPLLLSYGVLQPFLPATLVAGSSAPIWPLISIWRAAGWTAMLALLLYASVLALRNPLPLHSGREDTDDDKKNEKYPGLGFTRLLILAVWIVVLVASFRAGADMWDNPRYRATFAGLQAALAAWAWVEQRRTQDAWLRRALLGLGAILGWFLLWYIRRYTGFEWPVTEFFSTLGLGLSSAFLLIVWDWARGVREHREV